ncbi:hypothetical protein O2K51_06610 [Apibacter raozihei]|uniref:DUF4350 domain-containing protein n=1 Tax=Apibacter raozihei TaxID=2500547 RepID=UPI000FE3EAB8|nr:DUF4350 domain-containing protein [Apibacter raozihei]
MNKRLYIYLGIFILVIGIMAYLDYSSPKPVNWTQTYSTEDKIPFGSYILHKEMKKLFPDKNIEITNSTPSTYLTDVDYYSQDQLYFFIDKNTVMSDVSANWLLDFVSTGNDAFIISSSLPQSLQDSLHLTIKTSDYILKDEFSKINTYLTNPVFNHQTYNFKKIQDYAYFEKLDKANTVVLGTYKLNKENHINFIRYRYGEGYFYVNLLPEAYSNYFLLNDSVYTYAISTLNYINKKNIFWDERNKSVSTSQPGILYYIFNSPPLHWAWVILIISSVFYAVFFGKRLQRKIPIILPLANTTVEFTKTIGNLYYNKKEHKDIINKKIKYFLYFVKEKYFLNIDQIDTDFSKNLHLKSGVSQEITDKIIYLILKNRNSTHSSEEDLKILNSTIDLFYKNTY